MDDETDKSDEIEKLVQEFKKINKVTARKYSLECILTQLTLCNNIATLSKQGRLFNSKVIDVSCKVICDSVGSHSQTVQTLVIAIENVSERFTFESCHWHLLIGLNNDRTQGTWILENPLVPGKTEKFRVPLTDQNFQFPDITITVCLNFTIEFESKMYTKTFKVKDCTVDVLHFLDPEKCIVDTGIHQFFQKNSFVDISDEIHGSREEFPPVTRFVLRLDSTLKKGFVKDILLCDCKHRGFESIVDGLAEKKNVTVYYLGIQIDVNLKLSRNDVITVNCSNSAVLCALKASILRRLVTVEGITVEALDDENRDTLESLDLKLQTLSLDDRRASASSLSTEDLMEFYLELRDVSESIRFGVAHVID